MKSTQNNPKLFYIAKKMLLSPILTFLNASNKSNSFVFKFFVALFLFSQVKDWAKPNKKRKLIKLVLFHKKSINRF